MALSTNRTLITQTGINTHQVLNVGGLDSAGIATFSNFKTGSSNLHSTGLTVGDTFLHSTGVNLGTGATVSNNGNATFSGIITASSFVGDISKEHSLVTYRMHKLGCWIRNCFISDTNRSIK